MANKKITDATTATSVAGTDKVFLNQGGDLKQVDLNSAVANSQAVQTLNSNLISTRPGSDIENSITLVVKSSTNILGYIVFRNTKIKKGYKIEFYDDKWTIIWTIE